MVKILAVSDQIDPRVYSHSIKQRYADVDLVISCGDLSYLYLEFIVTALNKPLFFVHGNHDPEEEIGHGHPRAYPLGGENLHLKVLHWKGLLLAGMEGSIRYNRRDSYQYTQSEFWLRVFRLVPRLLLNKMLYGRYLDVFVSHAPPQGVHEGEDWTHQGIHAFRWLIGTFQPVCLIHGHVHRYFPDQPWKSSLGRTQVINAYMSQVIDLP